MSMISSIPSSPSRFARALGLAGLALLAACAGPGLGYGDAPSVQVTDGPWTFTVYRRGDDVQVVRTGLANRTQQARMIDRMAVAAETATGCDVRPRSIAGDANTITATLDCG